MKKLMKAVCSLLLFAVLFGLACPAVTVRASSAGSVNNMNVVFVLDGSGSMFTTDKDQLRFEALELFLGVCCTKMKLREKNASHYTKVPNTLVQI